MQSINPKYGSAYLATCHKSHHVCDEHMQQPALCHFEFESGQHRTNSGVRGIGAQCKWLIKKGMPQQEEGSECLSVAERLLNTHRSICQNRHLRGFICLKFEL